MNSFVGVKGISADTSTDVDTKLTESQRRKVCRSEKDSTVTQFWKYSQSGCIIECATRLIRNQFNCRPFFLPSIFPLKITNLSSNKNLFLKLNCDLFFKSLFLFRFL